MSQIKAFYSNESSINLKTSPHMVELKGLRENSKSILLKEIKPKGVYRNINGCILESSILEVIKTVYHFIDSNL